jgi:hypothetical protein
MGLIHSVTPFYLPSHSNSLPDGHHDDRDHGFSEEISEEPDRLYLVPALPVRWL